MSNINLIDNMQLSQTSRFLKSTMKTPSKKFCFGHDTSMPIWYVQEAYIEADWGK